MNLPTSFREVPSSVEIWVTYIYIYIYKDIVVGIEFKYCFQKRVHNRIF